MNSKAKRSGVRGGYVALFLASCLVPLFHFLSLDPALECLRSPLTGLMPGLYLFLRWNAQLSCAAPIAVLIMLALSWRFPGLNTQAVLSKTALVLFVLLSLYTVYLTVIFSGVISIYT